MTVAADGGVIRYCQYRNDFALVSRAEKRDRGCEDTIEETEGAREGVTIIGNE